MGSRKPDHRDANDSSKELSIEDTLAAKIRIIPGKGAKSGGHNPYDMFAIDKLANAPRKPPKKVTDLRKLSEWIQLTREVEKSKKGES